MTAKIFQKNLLQYVKYHSISVSQLAQRAHLSRTTLSKILNQRSSVKLSHAVLLSKVVNVDFISLNKSNLKLDDVKPFDSLRTHIDYLNIALQNLKSSVNFQQMLSIDPGLSTSEISKLFSGKVTDPYLSSLEKLLDATKFKDLSEVFSRGGI